MTRITTSFTCTALLVAFAGCGGDAAEEAPESALPAAAPTAGAPTGPPAVTILTPTAGETLATGDVHVTLAVDGIEVAPVAEGRMDTGHHHLFLDVDLTPWDQIIPLDQPQIVHMGDGRTEHTFEGLSAGEHRIIAVLADPTHTPLDPPAVDTVTFSVGG